MRGWSLPTSAGQFGRNEPLGFAVVPRIPLKQGGNRLPLGVVAQPANQCGFCGTSLRRGGLSLVSIEPTQDQPTDIVGTTTTATLMRTRRDGGGTGDRRRITECVVQIDRHRDRA